MEVTKDMINKLRTGGSLGDNEINIMVRWFTDLEACLRLFGAEYYLVQVNIRQQLSRLLDYQAARQAKQ